VKKSDLKNEIATAKNDPDMLGYWMGRALVNPDPVLVSKSGGLGLRLYDEVARDPHAAGVLQARYLAVAGAEIEMIPGDDTPRAQEIADFVFDALTAAGLSTAVTELMAAALYGFSAAEVYWTEQGGKWVPKKIMGKHARRFCFTPERELRLLTTDAMIDGIEVPPYKFIVHRSGDRDNPYGLGLGQRLWWWTWFKKHGMKFWAVFLEKFGQPTVAGKYPAGTDKAQQEKLLSAIESIQTDAGIIFPAEMMVEFLEAKRSGTDSYQGFLEFCDTQISKGVLSQTLTTETKGEGSYAASKIHESVRQDVTKADADLLAESLNESIVAWLVELNFGADAPKPKLWFRVEEEEDLNARAERDERLMKLGLPVSVDYFYDTYGIPRPDPGADLVVVPQAPAFAEKPARRLGQASQAQPAADPTFSEPDPVIAAAEAAQEQLDAEVSAAIPDAADAVEPWLAAATGWLLKQKSLERALSLINARSRNALNSLPVDAFANLLAEKLQQADALGRASVLSVIPAEAGIQGFAQFAESLWGPGTPFTEALDYFRAQAFTIARVASQTLLSDVKNAIAKGIETGATVADLASGINDLFETRGWTPLRPWHLDTVVRTNIQTAFQAGRYAQQTDPAVLDAAPFWQYHAVMDGSTRPAHAALNGKVFRADNPFWKTWYPPNGFNCFPAGTPVLTPSGWTNIETIGVGGRVIGGGGHEQRVAAIHRNWFNGRLVRLALENSRIYATPNHRILTMRGWVRADNLQQGDVLVQTAEAAVQDAAVGDVHRADAQRGYGRMPGPVEGEAARMLAPDAEVERRDEHVDPFRPRMREDDVVMDGLKAEGRDMSQHERLAPGGRLEAGGVQTRRPPHEARVGGGIFLADAGPSRGCAFFELFGCLAGGCVAFLELAAAGVKAVFAHLPEKLFHPVRRVHPALGRRVFPLGGYRLAAAAGLDAAAPHDAHERPDIDSPEGAYPPVGKALGDVAGFQGLGDGAPLDLFDSADDFIAWARAHCSLHRVLDVSSISYSDIVYNLSVENDETYVVPGATVHNCRCTVTALTAKQVARWGLTVGDDDPTYSQVEVDPPLPGQKGHLVTLMPDPGFIGPPKTGGA
jgi:SPP1 gp7 family putative phage head morphogenesis protein